MELVGEFIYSNIYTSSDIVKIRITTGQIESRWDMSALVNIQLAASPNWINTQIMMDLVLNGIAYRKSTNTFFLSGKMWNNLFEVILT